MVVTGTRALRATRFGRSIFSQRDKRVGKRRDDDLVEVRLLLQHQLDGFPRILAADRAFRLATERCDALDHQTETLLGAIVRLGELCLEPAGTLREEALPGGLRHALQVEATDPQAFLVLHPGRRDQDVEQLHIASNAFLDRSVELGATQGLVRNDEASLRHHTPPRRRASRMHEPAHHRRPNSQSRPATGRSVKAETWIASSSAPHRGCVTTTRRGCRSLPVPREGRLPYAGWLQSTVCTTTGSSMPRKATWRPVDTAVPTLPGCSIVSADTRISSRPASSPMRAAACTPLPR
jgi:hypothetical protein